MKIGKKHFILGGLWLVVVLAAIITVTGLPAGYRESVSVQAAGLNEPNSDEPFKAVMNTHKVIMNANTKPDGHGLVISFKFNRKPKNLPALHVNLNHEEWPFELSPSLTKISWKGYWVSENEFFLETGSSENLLELVNKETNIAITWGKNFKSFEGHSFSGLSNLDVDTQLLSVSGAQVIDNRGRIWNELLSKHDWALYFDAPWDNTIFTANLYCQIASPTLIFKFSQEAPIGLAGLKKNLSPRNWPVTFNPPIAGQMLWLDSTTLKFKPAMSPIEWERLLAANKLTLNWNKKFRSSLGKTFINVNSVKLVDYHSGKFIIIKKDNFEGDFIKSNELYSAPLNASSSPRWPDGNLTMTLRFNQAIKLSKPVHSLLEGDEMPVRLKFPAASVRSARAEWRDDSTLILKYYFSDENREKFITGYEINLEINDDLKTLVGDLPVGEFLTIDGDDLKKGLVVDPFVLGGDVIQEHFYDGAAHVRLNFNMPVNKTDLEKFLKVENESKYGKTENSIINMNENPVEPPSDIGRSALIKVAAEEGELISFTVAQGLPSANGVATIDRSQTRALKIEKKFTIVNTDVRLSESYPWKPYLEVRIKELLVIEGVAKHIKLEPPLDFTVEVNNYYSESRLRIYADFKAATPTKVTLLKGLPAEGGVLHKDVSLNVLAPKNEKDQKLIFTGRGRYLSPKKPMLVKIAGRNAEMVRIQGWRLYENNLPLILNVQDYDTETRTRLTQQMSKNIVETKAEVAAPEGQVFERLLDMKEFLPGETGVYLLKISPENKKKPQFAGESDNDYYYSDYYDYNDYYSNYHRYLPVVITDLGVTAHLLPGQITGWVNSLSGAAPISGGQVKVYDQANQVIAESRTNAEGFFKAEVDEKQAIFITVQNGGDLTYLMFGEEPQSVSEDSDYFDDDGYYSRRNVRDNKWYGGTGGYLPIDLPELPNQREYLTRGYEAFVFMPRDIWKPGETAMFKGLLRDKNLLPPSESFPVQWKIIDPDERVISQGQAQLSALGGLDFSSTIPFSAATGAYQVELSLPGSKNAIGSTTFMLEDFVPPRLAVNAQTEQKIYAEAHPDIKIEAGAKYLFGAPGVDLKWELDAVISERAFHPKGWDDFEFINEQANFEGIRERRLHSRRLNDKGQDTVSYKPEYEVAKLPNKLNIDFIIRVQEDGGRWNANKTSVEYFPHETILGLKQPKDLAPGALAEFELAAVNYEGQPAETKNLEVKFSKVVLRYYNSYRDGRYRQQTAEELLSPKELNVALKEGRGQAAFTPETSGTYELQVFDPASQKTLKRRFHIYGRIVAEEAPAAGRVEISFDKEFYKPGDNALVKIKAPFPGRLLVSLESDRHLQAQTLEMPTTEAEMRLPVTNDFPINAYVTATVIRPLAEGEKVYRAIGVKALNQDVGQKSLNVALENPARVKPSSSLPVKIKLTDAEGRPVAGEVTLSLVDEGVLSLTSFKTPDPWAAFTVPRSLATLFYDLYDLLMPIEAANNPFLKPGGGNELSQAGLFSPFRRKQEVLSIFKATLKTNERGELETELVLPEYSGQGRLMAVAVGRNHFGKNEAKINISRDFTAEATLPLVLAPGDVFEIPVRAFMAKNALAETGQSSQIILTTEGPISLIGGNRAVFNLKPGEAETNVFEAVAQPSDPADDRAGVAKVTIESRKGELGLSNHDESETFSQTFEVVVRPPFPRVAETFSATAESNQVPVMIDTSKYLKGTAEASFTLAKSPAIEAARAVIYLKDYPYGCLEQTTSKAWLFVAGEDLMAALEPEKNQDDYIELGIMAAVQRLAIMQTSKGGFAYWPGQSHVYEWGTVYAAHFLTEANRKIELPAGLMDKSLKWLRAYLAHTNDGDPYKLTTKAYACYVLGLNGEHQVGWINTLYDRFESLPPSGRLFLAGARALHEGHSEALKELEKKETDWKISTLDYRESSLESEPRNLALKLLIWTEIDPLAAMTNKLALLVADQGRGHRWSNTQENGLALYALTSYLKKSGLGQPYEAKLLDQNERVILSANNKTNAMAGPKTMASVSDQPLLLNIEGEGRPYYTITVAGVPLEAPKPKAEKLGLERTWILADGTRVPLTEKSHMPDDLTMVKGDLITVELEVETFEKGLQNLVLVDLLPGGFEVENPKLDPKTDAVNSGKNKGSGSGNPRVELREDRVVIIEPYISGNGRQVYRYSMRAITPGEYVLPPTIAEGMYEPAKQAILASGKVKVVNDR